MIDTVGSNLFITSQTRAPAYKTTLCPTPLLRPSFSLFLHPFQTLTMTTAHFRPQYPKACITPQTNIALNTKHLGCFFCLKSYSLLASLIHSYKTSKAYLCHFFENLPYLFSPFLPWDELTSPVLGPSGHLPHSDLCTYHSGVFITRGLHAAKTWAYNQCSVTVSKFMTGKKTYSFHCTGETDLKHIQQ